MGPDGTGARCKRCATTWYSIGWLSPGETKCLICGGDLAQDDPGADNADVARAAVLAFNEADTERLLGHMHPEIEWRPTGVLLGEAAHPYIGLDSMITWLGDINSLWSGIRFVERQLRIADDHRVLILGAITATDRTSAAHKAEPLAILFSFEDGLIRRMDEYLDWNEARAAAGVDPGS